MLFSITDGNGYPFLGKALYDNQARKSAQWHRPWTQAEKDKYPGGFMPVEYRGRYIKYFMGEPSDSSGLRHEYVDSTVTNGITYYYAVVSYDHGDDSLQLPPSESQSIIQRDVVTRDSEAFAHDLFAIDDLRKRHVRAPVAGWGRDSLVVYRRTVPRWCQEASRVYLP